MKIVRMWRMPKAEVAEPKSRWLAKVEHLRSEALQKLKIVVRNLAKIRELTGEGELVGLGKLLDEAGMQEAASTPDPRLARAAGRGASVRQKLTEVEGGSLSAEEASRELGMSKVALLKRRERGRVVAWRKESQRAFRFPAWQFRDGTMLPGVEETLDVLNEASRLDDYGRLLFFLSQSRFLGGKRPLDYLREGEVGKVLDAARGYGL
jgi:hypothetical protein